MSYASPAMHMNEPSPVGFRGPVAALVLCYGVFYAVLAATAGQWPENVASHFNAAGEANSWMTRTVNLVFWIGLSLFVPLLIVGVFYAVRFLPVGMVNIPHREYWLAPERREATARDMFRRSLWFACLMVLFFTVIYIVVLRANQVTPPRMESGLFLAALVGYLISVGVWVTKMVLHYRKPKAADA